MNVISSALKVSTSKVNLEDLRKLLPSRPNQVFALLDACDEPLIPEKVHELGASRAVSLYKGTAADSYWAIAPYLATVDPALLDWIMTCLDGTPWGLFLVANSDLATLRLHFRKFLTVLDPQGEPLYFRFYDPRVLPMFLETCLPAELQRFFGPVESFFSALSSTELLKFTS